MCSALFPLSLELLCSSGDAPLASCPAVCPSHTHPPPLSEEAEWKVKIKSSKIYGPFSYLCWSYYRYSICFRKKIHVYKTKAKHTWNLNFTSIIQDQETKAYHNTYQSIHVLRGDTKLSYLQR